MARVLYAHSRKATFIEVDRALLAERWEVIDFYQPGRVTNLARLLPSLLRADAVVGWWASWHTFWPITLAWLLRKPALLIVGGFDVASLPEVDYGFQRPGLRRWLSRWVIRRASRLMTNSFHSQREIEANIGIGPERVAVVHHGVPDPFGALPAGERAAVALSVGYVTRDNLEVKGQRAFVEAAALLPEVSFVLAGPLDDDPAVAALRVAAAPNVTFAGPAFGEPLLDLFRRASVYVQPSLSESFGIAVAEAMLAGCIPAVTDSGALPEVVGDVGVRIAASDAASIAAAVRAALELGPAERRRARERVLREFPIDMRRRGLGEQVERLLGG